MCDHDVCSFAVFIYQLNSLPAEKISIMATRIAAREQQAAARAYMSQSTSSDAGVRLSRGGPAEDVSWYHFDKPLMEDILSGKRAYDPHSATMRQKDEAGGYQLDRTTEGHCTVAEIMHFNDQQSKMHSPLNKQ